MKAHLRRLLHPNRLGIHRGPLALQAIGSFIMIYMVMDPHGTFDIARNTGLFVIIFSLVVGVHELCHLLAARVLGVEVESFALGFGPELIARNAFGIRWAFRALPLGGFVKLRGEDTADGPRSFAGTTTRRRVIILLAGPASNIALSFTLLIGACLVSGVALTRTFGVAFEILQLVLSKTGEAIANFLPHASTAPLDMPMVGIPGMISGVGTMVDMGPFMVVVLAAVISFSMGIMNGLPIPPLDGGQAFVAVLRHIFGARYPARVMAAATRLTFAMLMFVMVVVNGIDAFRSLIGYIPH